MENIESAVITAIKAAPWDAKADIRFILEEIVQCCTAGFERGTPLLPELMQMVRRRILKLVDHLLVIQGIAVIRDLPEYVQILAVALSCSSSPSHRSILVGSISKLREFFSHEDDHHLAGLVQMPEPVLRLICSFLEPEVADALARVCRPLRRLILSAGFYAWGRLEPTFSLVGTDPPFVTGSALRRIGPVLEACKVFLSQEPEGSISSSLSCRRILEKVLPAVFPKIKRLNLRLNCIMAEPAFQLLCTKLPAVTTLNFCLSDPAHQLSFMLQMMKVCWPGLKSIRLSCLSDLTDEPRPPLWLQLISREFGQFLLHFAPQLEELLVNLEPGQTMPRIFQRRVPCDAIGACRELRKLSLYCEWVLSDAEVRAIAQCSQLRELSVSVRTETDYLSPLRDLPNLAHFHCCHFEETHKDAEQLVRMLRENLTNVTHIKLILDRNHAPVSDRMLEGLAEGILGLKVLNLEFLCLEDEDGGGSLATITDEGMSHLMRMPFLQILQIETSGDPQSRSIANAEIWPIRGNFLDDFVATPEKEPVSLALYGAPFRYIQQNKVNGFLNRGVSCEYFGFRNSLYSSETDGPEDTFGTAERFDTDACCLSSYDISHRPTP